MFLSPKREQIVEIPVKVITTENTYPRANFINTLVPVIVQISPAAAPVTRGRVTRAIQIIRGRFRSPELSPLSTIQSHLVLKEGEGPLFDSVARELSVSGITWGRLGVKSDIREIAKLLSWCAILFCTRSLRTQKTFQCALKTAQKQLAG
jgi:hypothetical protein